MIRCRFHQPSSDPRPVNWPIKHPYWITGEGDDYFVIVAYVDDEAEILSNWPEARSLSSKRDESYSFTELFPMPDWFVAQVSP